VSFLASLVDAISSGILYSVTKRGLVTGGDPCPVCGHAMRLNAAQEEPMLACSYPICGETRPLPRSL